MAHDWYIKRGERTYGPLTSAQLKKLAGDGKVTAATEIRLGADGAWTTASRVKGLFVPQDGGSSASLSAPSISAMPPLPPPVARPADTRPPVASLPTSAMPSAAPPMARPVATATVARPMPTAGPIVEKPPLAGKLIGAVGLTFGTLALGTCWLSLVEPIFGWVGIAVGAMGLVLGISGLVVSALQNASGLVLNVAAASSALVGLVVGVALGIKAGLFSAPAPLVVAPSPIVVQSPPPPAPKVEPPAAEPEPAPPEPVWTDAGQAIEQGPIRARITAAAVEQIRLESANPLSMKREKAAPYLHVRVLLENISRDKIVSVPGWMATGGSSAALGAVGQALGDSELGKQLAGASAAANLIDDRGNAYPQIEAIRLPSSHAEMSTNPSLRPGDSSEKHLLFDPPIEQAEYLRIELAPGGFGGSEPLRFQIPRAMWTGGPADENPADGVDAPAAN